MAHPKSGAPRSLQSRGADPGERQQLPVEHFVDLQGPSPTRRQARESVLRPGAAERRGRQSVALADGSWAQGLHRPLAAGQRQRGQGGLNGGRFDPELLVPPVFRLSAEKNLNPTLAHSDDEGVVGALGDPNHADVGGVGSGYVYASRLTDGLSGLCGLVGDSAGLLRR